VRASQEFATEDVGRSWGLLGFTFAVFVALWAVVMSAPALLPSVGPLGVSLVGWGGSLLLGLVGVRFFIFYHDFHHGAIFRASPVAKVPMTLIGFYTLAVPTVWKETHDYHHRNNAKLTGSSIGSYPTVSLGMYKGIKPRDRQVLKVVRHPLTILFGLLTTFFVGFCHDEAGASARHMTKTKVGIAANAVQRAEYERLAMADLYLQADYEFFFRSCMRTHGFDR